MAPLECVLLIDDNDITNFLHRELLGETALARNVVVRTNGRSGLEYLDNPTGCVPYLVLLDVHMPVMDGFDFLDRYLTSRQESFATIVLLTTSYNPRDRDRATQAGIPYLIKPLQEKDLQALVKHYHDSRLPPAGI